MQGSVPRDTGPTAVQPGPARAPRAPLPRRAVLALAAPAGLLLLPRRARASHAGPLILRTHAVLEFRQTEGLPAWREDAMRRAAASEWRFDGQGGFSAHFPGMRTDFTPIPGTYEEQGDTLAFQGGRRSVFNPGIMAVIALQGSIDLRNGILRYASRSFSTSNVIMNNTPMGTQSSSGEEAVLQMARAE